MTSIGLYLPPVASPSSTTTRSATSSAARTCSRSGRFNPGLDPLKLAVEAGALLLRRDRRLHPAPAYARSGVRACRRDHHRRAAAGGALVLLLHRLVRALRARRAARAGRMTMAPCSRRRAVTSSASARGGAYAGSGPGGRLSDVWSPSAPPRADRRPARAANRGPRSHRFPSRPQAAADRARGDPRRAAQRDRSQCTHRHALDRGARVGPGRSARTRELLIRLEDGRRSRG